MSSSSARFFSCEGLRGGVVKPMQGLRGVCFSHAQKQKWPPDLSAATPKLVIGSKA